MIDFEQAIIKLLEVHLSSQLPIELEIYEAADVPLYPNFR